MTSCPACQAPSAQLGPLPGSNLFAGRALPAVLSGGALYRCTRCALGFRHPRLAKQELDALYAGASPQNWQYEPAARADWTLAARAIAGLRKPDAAVLDVGCFDGAFLATLSGVGEKAGIEIVPDAVTRARSRGIEVIGTDYGCLRGAHARFDAVTAFDIIEHVDDPLAFVGMLASALKPGGLLLISTGNLDAPSWRMMRHRYWYAAIPEHISFLSVAWFRHAAAALDLEVAATHRYAHAAEPLHRRIAEAASNIAFLLAPRLIGALRRRRSTPSALDPSIIDAYPPRWMSARDHILVTLRKA